MKVREQVGRFEKSLDCVHCGLCLPACPTYRLTGKETASPRGRIFLMRAIAEGRLAEDRSTLVELDRCLVCRACESVCPSGVEFGSMMELTRDIVEPTTARSRTARGLKRWLFRSVLPHPRRLKLLAELARWYRLLGLRRLGEIFGLPHLFGPRTVLREAMLPEVPPLRERGDPPEWSLPDGAVRAKVGFLVGCLAHELLPGANHDAIRVLQRNGCAVFCPKERPCCGALPVHFGDREAARRLARRSFEAFPEDLDAIVVSAAGCASSMKEAANLFEAGSADHARALRFAAKVKDFSEYLVALPLRPPRGRLEKVACFDAPCHLRHAQRIESPPLELLRSVPGLELRPFRGQDDCCGAAGLYTVTEPEQSIALLKDKIQAVRDAAPDLLVTANPGCQLQLTSGVREWAPKIEVLHLAQVLERAYRAERTVPAEPHSTPSS